MPKSKSLVTLTQGCRLGEKKTLPCLPSVDESSFLGRPPFIHTSFPQNQPNYTSPPLALNTKKNLGRKSRLLMGKGLAHRKYGNSLHMIHKIDLKDRLDRIPRTTF